MRSPIRRVAVLGAGTMGSAIAAHLANAGLPTLLLDTAPTALTPEEEAQGLRPESPEFRNRRARQARDRLVSAQPPALFLPELVRWIEPGNVRDDLRRVNEVDWIVEAVTEDPGVKIPLLKRVDACRRPGTIVSTTTSGLSVNMLAEEMSADFRRHWLGTHFFYPPRTVKLVEVIPARDTLPEVVEAMSSFLDRTLGKSVVHAKDTPNFVANRIGLFTWMHTIHTMLAEGWSVAEVDALTGPVLGHPQRATFRALDLMGVDLLCQMAQRTYHELTDDEGREVYRIPPLLEEMVRRGWVGARSGQGFYRKVAGEGQPDLLVLDVNRLEYVLPASPPPALLRAGEVDDLGQRIRYLLRRPDRVGHFAWELLRGILLYSARRVPEIADDLATVDRALRWGFGWRLGPFELWDELGVTRLAHRVQKEGAELPPVVERLLASGYRSFYQRGRGRPRVIDVSARKWHPLESPPGAIELRDLSDKAHVVRENPASSLLDLGNGVGCLEFHGPMNAIGRETLALAEWSLEEIGRNFEGLVLASDGEDFSAGVDFKELLVLARAGAWGEIGRIARVFQDLNQALRYSPRPVVVAPFGLTLGAGCQMAMSADCAHAAAETTMGLAEAQIGLIPAGGGMKEMLCRALDRRPAGVGDPFPLVEFAWHLLREARISSSALEARRLLFLRDTDCITMNRDRLVGDAVQTVLALARADYRPPMPRDDILALGEPALARMREGLDLLVRAGGISAHDRLVGEHLARVLCGGEKPGARLVSEMEILELEREAFLSLLGEKKTQDRLEHMLKTGNPLRN